MTASAGQIVALLDSVARQLQASTLNVSDCATLVDYCHAVPQELSSSERQAVTSSLLRLSHALVATDWNVADHAGGFKYAVPEASCQAVAACCQLGAALRLDAAQAAHVCATVAVVLGYGRRALRRLTGQPVAAAAALSLIAAQNWAMFEVRALATASGIPGNLAAQLAPVAGVVHWLAAASHLLERLLRTTAGSSNLHSRRFDALFNYCTFLHGMFLAQEYARLPQQLLHSATDAATVTQLLLHGLAAGTAAVLEGRTDGWQLLTICNSLLLWTSESPATACRTLGSSLRSSTGGPPQPLPHLLAEVVATLPGRLPASLGSTTGPHQMCITSADLLARLYLAKAQSAPPGSHPASQLRPTDWQALGSLATLAPLLLHAAASMARHGNSDTALQAGKAAHGCLVLLHLLHPPGTPCSTPDQLGWWCELASGSWHLLATAAAEPQLQEQLRANAVLATWKFNCRFIKSVDACLPPRPGAAASGSSSAAAAGGSWDATLPPLLQLGRQLCRAAHFQARSDAATSTPVAAALLRAGMPVFLVSSLDLALRPLTSPGGFSAKQQEQALLLVAATRSALQALPPAACRMGVPGLACGTFKPWLTHPNALSSAPAVLRQLVGLLEQALERWLQDPNSLPGTPSPKTPEVRQEALELAAAQPRLAAACLGHPALPALLERCAAEDGQAADGIATQLRGLMDGLASQAADSSTAEQEQEQGGRSELEEASASLRNLLAALPSGGSSAEDSSGSVEERLQQLASPALLQQAAALAAALAAHAEPTQEQQAADALALARALAASPGCNNLACPDWTGEVGRLKVCEACRTARYCSARCQREAWRTGGHRQCCAALAAERQQGRRQG